jgi:hypothetical protein
MEHNVLRWIEKIIWSCETVSQVLVADKLIDRCFRKTYNIVYGTPLYDEWRRISWLITCRKIQLDEIEENKQD